MQIYRRRLSQKQGFLETAVVLGWHQPTNTRVLFYLPSQLKYMLCSQQLDS